MWFWEMLWSVADLVLSFWPWSTRDQDAKIRSATFRAAAHGRNVGSFRQGPAPTVTANDPRALRLEHPAQQARKVTSAFRLHPLQT